MITAVRSATIQQGTAIEAAFEWAVKVAMYLNENLGMNTKVQRNVAGSVYQVHWVTTVESLAQVDEVFQRMQADEGYGSLLAEAREQGLFDVSSIVDNLYQSIP
ncbi:MAG: hypothetical protein JSV68_09710 [Anaerolineaceae bacterium]|nr:MAG: hypothetical protein JSV68_09710 [Anaerolineaceae bacterium]